MPSSQQYIGTPNGVVVCLDSVVDHELVGRLYHFYQVEPVPYQGVAQVFLIMEDLFERLQFPRATNTSRYFTIRNTDNTRRTTMEKVITDQELSNRHGELGTFIIRVQHRQNSSWQGRVTWLEEDKTLSFRSTWELMKLVEDALNSMDIKQDVSPRWFSEDGE